jgi:nickel/cobalt transporter (NicO) family protein
VIGQARLLPGDWGWLDEWLLRLVDGGTAGFVAAALAVATAVGVGVVHAAGPGHGKVLVGSYLAGTDGRRRDAIALGILVAAMHTGSVLVLGAAYLATQRLPWGGAINHVLELAVALAIVVVGVVTFRRTRWRTTHDDAHVHAPPSGIAPLSRSGVLALAAAGGLVPSPSAFLVLVTAVALGRPWLGLVLVGAFSVGLAVTLAVVGLVVVSGRDRLIAGSAHGGWGARAATALPTVAAAAVVVTGVVLAVLALARF